MATRTIQLFHTCLVNEVDPDVGMAVVRVLERAGVAVQVPLDQTCCGQPAYNAGFHDEARQVRASDASVCCHVPRARSSCHRDRAATCWCTSIRCCSNTIPSGCRSRARSRRAYASSASSPVDVAPASPALEGRSRTRVAYHPSCHLLRGLGVKPEPGAQLASVAGPRRRCRSGSGRVLRLRRAVLDQERRDLEPHARAQGGCD